MVSQKRRRNSVSSESEDDEDKRTLFVANLHSNTTEEILFELFLQAGPIERVRIPKDKDTNRQKTFGFVTYKYACAVPYAVRLYDGIKLYGQRLTIRAREVRETKDTFNSTPSRNFYGSSSSLRHGFQNAPDIATKIESNNCVNKHLKNFELTSDSVKQFAPQLVDGIRSSFENPFKSSSSRPIERHRNDMKHQSNESRYRNRDKPYQRPNHGDRHNQYSHRNDRRSDQRRNR